MRADKTAAQLAMQGSELTVREVASLEAKLRENPRDIQTRTHLLGYYFLRANEDEHALHAKCQHIAWLIEHEPEEAILETPFCVLHRALSGDVAFNEVVALWEKQLVLYPDNVAIIKNVVSFYTTANRKRAIDLSKRLIGLAPAESDNYQNLGQLYALDIIGSDDVEKNVKQAGLALECFEKAYEYACAEGRDVLRSDLAKAAFIAQRFDQAAKYAEDMLENNPAGWNHGNNIYAAHSVLGQLALRLGDVKQAKLHLLKSGQTPGSPQLGSFGPDMALAQALLLKGECSVVLAFLKLCAVFWRDRSSHLEGWIADLENERMPDLSSNIR